MRSLTPTDLQSVLGLLVSVVTTFLTVSYVASNATEARLRLASTLGYLGTFSLRGGYWFAEALHEIPPERIQDG